MSIDYLLHESPVGYAVFEVVHQPDTIGNRLKEVQDSVQVLSTLTRSRELTQQANDGLGPCKIWEDGQTGQLRAFSVRLHTSRSGESPMLIPAKEEQRKLSRTQTIYLKALCRTFSSPYWK